MSALVCVRLKDRPEILPLVPDKPESVEMPSQAAEGDGMPVDMECFGAAGEESLNQPSAVEVEMLSQSQTVWLPSQSQMSQGKDELGSQEQPMDVASQGSQGEMEIEYTATLPLEGALNTLDEIEFGKWSVGNAWRQPEIGANIEKDQTAEIDTGLNKVRIREAVLNKNCMTKYGP